VGGGSKNDSTNQKEKGHDQHPPDQHLYRYEFLQALLLLARELDPSRAKDERRTSSSALKQDLSGLLRTLLEQKLVPHAIQIEKQYLHSDELRQGMGQRETQAMVARNYDKLLFVYKVSAMMRLKRLIWIKRT
jgi:hypothetical protein